MSTYETASAIDAAAIGLAVLWGTASVVLTPPEVMSRRGKRPSPQHRQTGAAA